jgi:acyl transferase domain-containing protein/acyl carrier protein
MSNNSQENSNYKELMKNALLEIKKLRSELAQSKETGSEPIAIIGMECRFPGKAVNLKGFWELLKNGEDAITEVPSSRWNMNDFYDSNSETPGKTYTKHGGFLQSVDEFDPLFFGISPREAASMDPQQRILLEVAWQALCNANQNPKELKGTQTGVFVGISTNEYGRYFLEQQKLENIDVYFTTGNALNAAAGRLSYILGLQGPSMAIDTACSSSLVAIHNACQSLRLKECKMAIVAGSNLMLGPESTIALAKTKLLSVDGKCKTFDDSADGIVRGEGCGVVILKKLSEAIKDKNPVWAVIKSSAVNQDGASSGFTVPNGSAQKDLLQRTMLEAGILPNQIDYVEAHGTGTALGDPIEINALASVYAKDRNEQNPLLVGSVKTNIGHLEAAAGIAGLIKVVLSLQNECIPNHLNVSKLNSRIPWDMLAIKITTSAFPWPSVENKKRIAGVSSFGASGTNAHIIVEEGNKIEEVKNPTVNFKKERYWVENKLENSTGVVSTKKRQHALFVEKVYSPFLKDVIYENTINLQEYPYLIDHKINNAVIVPGAFYISSIIASHRNNYLKDSCTIENLVFYKPLIIDGSNSIKSHINIVENENKQTFKLASFVDQYEKDKKFVLHVSGNFAEYAEPEYKTALLDVNKIYNEAIEEYNGSKFYQGLRKYNVQIEDTFQWIHKIWRCEDEAWAFLKQPENLGNLQDYELHPCILDSCIQFASTTIEVKEGETFIPFSMAKISFCQSPKTKDLWCKVSKAALSKIDKPLANVTLLDTDGNLVMKIEGIEYMKVNLSVENKKVESGLLDYLYEVTWMQKSIPQNISSGNNESWLLFADENGIAEKLALKLSAHNYKCILVKNGETYQSRDKFNYEINPKDYSHYEKLLKDITGLSCKGVIHLWGLNSKTNVSSLNLDSVINAQQTGSFSLLYLTQALSTFQRTNVPALFVVGSSVQNIDLNNPINIQQAPLFGLGRVVVNEYPEYNTKLIDLSSDLDTETKVSGLMSELFSQDKDREIAICKNKRFVARLNRLNNINTISSSEVKIDSDSTYLISGGMGDLGMLITNYLLDKGAKNIVSLGRNLKSNEQIEKASDKAKQLGACLSFRAVDVSNPTDLKHVFNDIQKSAYPLKGIIHAAGLVDDDMLAKQTIERFNKVYQPKVGGVLALHELSKSMELDFFICFSSMAAVWGTPGQGSYAAANSFMDGFMQFRRQQGLPGLSINWGAWSEVGMGAKLNSNQQNRMSKSGIGFISPNDGLTLLEELIKKPLSQVGVYNIDWKNIARLISLGDNKVFFEELLKNETEKQKDKGSLITELTAIEISKRKTYLQKYIQNEIARVLHITDPKMVEPRLPLFDLGLDSFMAVELKNKLENNLDTTLSSSLLFNHPNLESIVNFLISDVIVLPFTEETEKIVDTNTDIEREVYAMSIEEVNKELNDLLKDI